MKRAGVLGYPVGHSLSPKLHGYWLNYYGINGDYSAIEVLPEDLAAKLKTMHEQGYRGCNITIPHKEAALSLMDELSEEAKNIGAVNTVVMREDGAFFGTNTDAYGFIENLRQSVEDVKPYLEHCLILGAGGAAKAVHYALKQAGAKRVSISNRSRERCEAFDAEIIDWEKKDAALEDVTLLINTTSLGMRHQPPLDLSLAALPNEALVTDIVYQPLMTDLLLQAKQRGNITVTGIGMLIYQAVPGFEAWFGQKPEVSPECFALLHGALS